MKRCLLQYSGIALMLIALSATVTLAANSYYVRGPHSYFVNASSTSTYITLVRTSGRDSADIAPRLVTLRGKGFGIVNDAHFIFSRYSIDSVQTINVYFFANKYRDTSIALLLIPVGSRTDTVRFTGTDPRIEPALPNGPCYSLGIWGQSFSLGYIDSTQNPSTYKWDYSWDWIELPGTVTLTAGTDAKRIHLRLVASDAWYLTSQSMYDSLGLGSSHPQELYTTTGYKLGYRSHGVEYDTALLISESVGGSCTQRDTVTLYVHDIYPQHIWQKLSVGTHDLGEVAIGDTQCIDIPIVNTTGMAVTIDSFTVDTYYAGFDDWSYSTTSTPFALAAGDTTYFHLCYHATHYNRIAPYGNWPITNVAVSYSNASHLQGRIRFTSTASTPRAITFAQDTIRMNDVMVDGYGDVTFNIYHQDDSDKTFGKFRPWLWADNMLAVDEWHLMTDSVQLHPFDTIPVTVRFAPYEVGSSWIKVEYWQGTYPNSPIILARAIDSSKDSLGLFDPPEQSVLTLKTGSSTTTRTFYFTNNSGGNIVVTDVSIKTGAHFQITGRTPTALPDTMANGDVLAVDVQFDGDTTGFYRDSLIITTSDALQSHSFDLQALRVAAAGVRRAGGQSLEIQVQPVPADAELQVHVPGAHASLYEVYDVLGHRLLADRSAGGDWRGSVAALPSGTYVLRVSGLDADDHAFATSKRFVKR